MADPRHLDRATPRERWKIGQSYHLEPLSTVEVRLRVSRDQGFPPFTGLKSPWTDKSLSHAIGMALLGALTESRLIATRPALQVGERSGGYVRLFLENASKEEIALFAESLQEMFAPLHKPRYVIPRSFDRLKTTWLSRLLPGVVGRYFQRRESVLVMWHAVPWRWRGIATWFRSSSGTGRLTSVRVRPSMPTPAREPTSCGRLAAAGKRPTVRFT